MQAPLRPFTLFLIGILLSSLAFSPFILDYTLTPRLIILACVLSCVFLLMPKGTLKIPSHFILMTYFLFVAFSWLSISWSHLSSEAIFENAKLCICFLVFILSYHFFHANEKPFMILLCKISILLFLAQLVVGVYQIIHLPSFEKASLYTVYGMNSHKNLFSSFILLQLPFVILCINKLSGERKNFWIITILIIYIALLAFLQTKAVWIGCLVSVLFFFIILLYKKAPFTFNLKISIAVLVILANVFFIFVLPNIVKRGIDHNISQAKNVNIQQKQELDQERLVLWDKTYTMFNKHPAIGVGAGNWQIYFPDATLKNLWRAEDLNYTFQRPHNDLLWILSETGLIGFNLFVIFILSLWASLVHVIKISSFSKQQNLELILFACIIPGFFTAAFFDFPKERIEHMVWLNIILGSCFYTVYKYLPSARSKEFTFKPIHISMSIALCVFVLICGIYRYLGEFHTRKMYDHKAQNNLHGLISEGNKATSFVYKVDPTSLPVKWYTGNAHALQGTFALANKDLLEAYKQNPYNRNVINDLGSSYAQLNMEDSAINCYKRSALISPRFDDPKLNMAAIYIRQKNFRAADSCLRGLFHDSERRTNYQKMVDAFLPDENHKK